MQKVADCAAETDAMRILRTRIRPSACTKWWVDSQDGLSSFIRIRSWMPKVFRVMAQVWYRMT